MPIDLDEILGKSEPKEQPVSTSVRIAPSVLAKLDEIAKARRMSRTRLLNNLIRALIKDYEEQHGAKRR